MPQQVLLAQSQTSEEAPVIDLGVDDTSSPARAKGNEKINQDPATQQVTGANGPLNNPSNGISNKTMKLNGLKNRIIQRPPPLILDKVSNFHDTQATNSTTQQPQLQQQSAIGGSCLNTRTQNDTNQSNPTNTSANHKFWASLNQNASRIKGAGSNSESSNTKESIDSLGQDLIITHRTSATIGAARPSQTTMSDNELSRPTIDEEAALEVEATKPHDVSNSSEQFNDSSGQGGGNSENDGGNLIGVDTPASPASSDTSKSHRNSEPPASAASSRPRSNNPFLTMDDELTSSGSDTKHNNFHKRPGSFMAATDNNLTNQHHLKQPKQVLMETDSNNLPGSHLDEHFSNLNIEDHNRTHSVQRENPYFIEREVILVGQHVDQKDSAVMYSPNSTADQQSQRHQQPNYGGFYQPGSYINYNSAISADSETTVCKPPLSATMQLPHWKDAIYELNNAILEINSVSGGSENGQFIFITESGDIILELDQIKVSGFTLTEFIDLVESKQVHLLKAVQTQHSFGLTIDLKSYLNCCFPKKSSDKELQDLVRENIYLRTIPCTTRPPKEGEVDKVDYHFLTKDQFVEMNNRDMLLECGTYGGHYYGTMKPLSDLNSLTTYDPCDTKDTSNDKQQPSTANKPASALIGQRELVEPSIHNHNKMQPLYENQESLKQIHREQAGNTVSCQSHNEIGDQNSFKLDHMAISGTNSLNHNLKHPTMAAVDSETLPHGWEQVIDQTHGTYYIDHNFQRTQYERPYEVELTKGIKGFGFSLIEAENGLLLVRSVIPGGPAHINGAIRPGDILISAVGVPVAGLQHTDIARLFSTFAVGDRVRLTFARSSYEVDANLVPDEYLFSNGTNGDLAIAVNSGYYSYLGQNMLPQNPHIVVNQEFEFITVTLKRGEDGFGFEISDSVAGQKVRKIKNNETCTKLKQGDIILSINGQDITKLTHKEVVERLKNCPSGQDVSLIIKRRKRFRSKTPMALRSENDDYYLDSTPQRNCKTPSLDGLMLRRSVMNPYESSVSRNLFPTEVASAHPLTSNNEVVSHPALVESIDHNLASNYCSMPSDGQYFQSIYGQLNPVVNDEIYYDHQPQAISVAANSQLSSMNPHGMSFRTTPSLAASDGLGATLDNVTTNSANHSEASLPPSKFADVSGLSQMNQFNNFMNNDKLVMMQMQQQQQLNQESQIYQPPIVTNPLVDYQQMPLYSNSDILKAQEAQLSLPNKPLAQFLPGPSLNNNNFQYNYYANNEELALQNVQYGLYSQLPMGDQASFIVPNYTDQIQPDLPDEYEYHQVDLDKGNADSNWGIRLIGGSEVDRAISIGSIVLGGAASKNGSLKSGDEIISINGINVVGATHQHVVELISACSNQASLVVRRKKFAEACEVTLTRNMDEGFGFVIISSGNCALIGRIIEGSTADRCKQLHVRDRIIAVNGRYISRKMQHPEIVNMIKECGSTLRLRIIPADCYTVELIKSSQSDNFGFSMRGGSEYDGTPLYILRVAPNGLARDLLNVGDEIIEINGIPTVGMTHQQAATIIKYSDPIVKLKLRRSFVTPPSLLVDSPRALQKYNQVTAEMKTVNVNVTPNYTQDGSASSELCNSLSQQYSTSMLDQPSQSGVGNNSNSLVYSQSMPLYAT